MDCIRQLGLIPWVIRSDRGTENTIICGIQRFLRRNDLISNKDSFVYGSSTRNQQIECWWSILRPSRLNWSINFFKDVCAENVVDTSLTYTWSFCGFCFLGILQEELDEKRRLWNNHFIRNSWNAKCPGSRPAVLFLYLFSCGRKRLQINFSLNLALPYCETPQLFGSTDDIVDFAALIKNERNITMPRDSASSKTAFYNSTSKLWFCLKRFFVQICSSLFIYYLHALHSDARKICWRGGSAGVDKQFV